jgi:selenocysteine lyase/cysteine desulfurase
MAQQAYEPEGTFTPKEGAARFDSDWLALPSLVGLITAIDLAPEWRFEAAAAVASRCRELLVEAGVEVATDPGHATLVTFVPHGDPAETVAEAYRRGVVVRDLSGTPWIRVSCGYWTNEKDLERLVAVLR